MAKVFPTNLVEIGRKVVECDDGIKKAKTLSHMCVSPVRTKGGLCAQGNTHSDNVPVCL